METQFIDACKETIANGGIILFPTDTIWGIGCDATNDEACQKIIKLKQRPDQKSFVLLADSFAMVEKYIPEFPEVIYDLVDLSTKPMTIIYPNAKNLAASVIAEDGSVGIRITKDPLCLSLIRALGKPIVATSANLSGFPHANNYSEIHPALLAGVDGVCAVRTEVDLTHPSQIIKIGLNSSIEIIRS
jgi:L-threonylcarbamoyladenylate synthase